MLREAPESPDWGRLRGQGTALLMVGGMPLSSPTGVLQTRAGLCRAVPARGQPQVAASA